MRKTLSLFLFFLKTVFFSHVNNPAFYCFMLIACLLYSGGDLKKPETAFLFLIIAVSLRFMPSLKAVTSVYSDSSESLLFRCMNLLPVKRNDFVGAYFFAAAVYILLLISICSFFGINTQTPPDIVSMSPTEIVTDYNEKRGVTYRYVGGIITIPDSLDKPKAVQYRIPIKASLIFGHLTSDIIIIKDKICDSVLQFLSFDKRTPEEIFSGDVSNLPAGYFSGFLSSLFPIHFRRLMLLSFFAFTFFINDCINMYMVSNRSKKYRILLNLVNFSFYTLLLATCTFILFDLFLSESMLITIANKISCFRTYIISICLIMFTVYILKVILFFKTLNKNYD